MRFSSLVLNVRTDISPAPLRAEMNASHFPSGEYRGRASVAGWEISRWATPPAKGTVQISLSPAPLKQIGSQYSS